VRGLTPVMAAAMNGQLEALRLQLAELLPRGSADPETLAELQALEVRLRSPQARGGHRGPSSPSR